MLAALHGLRLDEMSVESDTHREETFGQRIPVLLWGGVVMGEGRFSAEIAIGRVLALLADERFGNSAEP